VRRGSEGLCRSQVRRGEPPVLPEPLQLLLLTQVRLGGILPQEHPWGFAAGLSTPVPSLFPASAGAPCVPLAAPACCSSYPGTAVWMQPSLASTSSVRPTLLQRDPRWWGRQGTRAMAGAGDTTLFRTGYSSIRGVQKLLFSIVREGSGSGLDLRGEGCAVQTQIFMSDEARRTAD